uniref:Carbonyl reductase n=1 Tax=Rhabditophanes sp. KR3021 TaxID=114890 RepID=A0AC35TR40_9BILA
MKTIIVTGANKGIGYGIVRNLIKQVKDTRVYLTARDVNRGNEAVESILKEFDGTLSNNNILTFYQLDIDDETTVIDFARYLNENNEKIDVLINNAGYAFDNNAPESPLEQAQYTIKINYYGTKRVSNYLIPLIKDGGRIVNVCSGSGKMTESYTQEIKNLFNNDHYTIETIDKFVEDYKKYCEPDTRAAHGYANSAYKTSKVAEIALTILQHRLLKDRHIKAIACCPGYVDTDMSNHKGHLTIDQGAETPIFCALDANVPSGKFVEEKHVAEWIL